MESDWDDYEVDTNVGELWAKLENMRTQGRDRRPIVRRSVARGVKLEIGVVAIALAMGLAAAVVLFSHSLSYTPPTAKVSTTCSNLSGATSGSTIVFACSTNPALSVAPGATGTVTYSAFNPALPVSILDIYLIDTAVTLGPTCSTTSSNGNEPVSMAPGGATVTISQTAGNLRPNHNYNYCMDIAVFPPSFTASVSWSQ